MGTLQDRMKSCDSESKWAVFYKLQLGTQKNKMKEALKSFKGYLTSNNLKLTQQRLLIFKVFMSDDSKVSSENLHQAVQSVDTTVSRSTVYRTIKHFHMAGIARCIHHGEECTCYEPMGDHCSHMICEHCGKSIPVRNPYIDCLQQETARQQGFTLFRHQTVLYGICLECKGLGNSACNSRTAKKASLEKE